LRHAVGFSRQPVPQQQVPWPAQNFPHLNVYLGIWESSKYRSATEEQMAKAIELANKYPNIVEYVIVGNECLDQDFADGAVKVDQLIADINKIKQSVPANVKVTTCLGFHSGLDPEKMEDGSPIPTTGQAMITENGSCSSQKPIP
jgi:exo-beta-1,3-glucanase (GH17 family)